jgi:hypothetical protein
MIVEKNLNEIIPWAGPYNDFVRSRLASESPDVLTKINDLLGKKRVTDAWGVLEEEVKRLQNEGIMPSTQEIRVMVTRQNNEN